MAPAQRKPWTRRARRPDSVCFPCAYRLRWFGKHWGDSGGTPVGKDREIRVRTGNSRFQPQLAIVQQPARFLWSALKINDLFGSPRATLQEIETRPSTRDVGNPLIRSQFGKSPAPFPPPIRIGPFRLSSQSVVRTRQSSTRESRMPYSLLLRVHTARRLPGSPTQPSSDVIQFECHSPDRTCGSRRFRAHLFRVTRRYSLVSYAERIRVRPDNVGQDSFGHISEAHRREIVVGQRIGFRPYQRTNGPAAGQIRILED
jgi:cold shock CspA family protein